ncbi:hypothetical protein PanWU01x14_310790 [Parasponia andersonii]|uniref:Uncharacterized protein n=1 Tax=Parasponia andersonii TaxID=3476 RepID=A0A2P5AQD7_PARAD|nr:hypothetical protein PanWU01x14_310790 [Parasponia andersonii]
MANHYQELCRFQTRIVTKAAENEKTYEIAISGLKKILKNINANLRGREIEKPSSNFHTQMVYAQNESEFHNNDENNIRGIKIKGRARDKSSRPKSSLEMAKKEKRVL